MELAIEIWDLDIMDEVQPSAILGGVAEKKKKGKKKSIKYKKDSHTDSVLGLAWNKEYRNILASASADKQVKIWDVATGKCELTMEHHTDKVQSIAWNHYQPQVLLSGSFDHTVVMRDGRTPSHSGIKWTVDADVENVAWDPHTEHSFVVSLENGMVTGFDIRAADLILPLNQSQVSLFMLMTKPFAQFLIIRWLQTLLRLVPRIKWEMPLGEIKEKYRKTSSIEKACGDGRMSMKFHLNSC